MPIILTNRKATFDYEILTKYVAGMSLSGGMVKLMRGKEVNITGKFIIYQNGQLQIIGLGSEKFTENIPLLMKEREIANIRSQIEQKGVSCILLNIQAVRRWLKAEIAIVRGKKNFQKKDTIKKRDLDREERKGLL